MMSENLRKIIRTAAKNAIAYVILHFVTTYVHTYVVCTYLKSQSQRLSKYKKRRRNGEEKPLAKIYDSLLVET